MFGAQATKLKFYKTLGIYRNSTGNVTFNPETLEADSFKWWVFVKKIKGKVVFNDFNYSQQTSCHQSAVRELLEELGIKIDVTVYSAFSLDGYSRYSYGNSFLSNALEDKYYQLYTLEHENLTARYSRDRDIESIEEEIETLRGLGCKFSNISKSRTKKRAVADRERLLESKREENRVAREKRKELEAKYKDDMNDLEAVDFDRNEKLLNDFSEIA